MMGRRHGTRVALCVATGALALGAVLLAQGLWGCGDERVTRTERGGVGGRVSGRVTGPVGLLTAMVQLESIEGSYWEGPSSVVAVRSDDPGRFGMDAPAGRYRIGVLANPEGGSWETATWFYWRRDGITSWSDLADTLQVENGASIDSIEFAFGGVALELELAPELIGHRLRIDAVQGPLPPRRDGERFSRFAPAESTRVEVAFDPLPPGRYRFLVSDIDPATPGQLDGAWLWLPDAMDEQDADTFRVLPGERTKIEARFAPEFYRVEGVVDGAWMTLEPGRRPSVGAYASDSTRLARAYCDASGAFALAIPWRIPLRLRVESFDTDVWFGAPDGGEGTVYPPPPSGTLAGLRVTDSAIDAELEYGDRSEGGPLDLSLWDEHGSRVSAQYHRLGSAVLHVPGPGKYRLKAVPSYEWDSDWLAQWFDGADSMESAAIIEVREPGEIRHLTLRPQLGGRIEGSASDPTGGAVRNAYVFVTRADSEILIATVEVHAGLFTARALPSGKYRIGADWNANGYWPGERDAAVWYPNALDWSEAEVITVTAPDTLTNIDLVLPWPSEARP